MASTSVGRWKNTAIKGSWRTAVKKKSFEKGWWSDHEGIGRIDEAAKTNKSQTKWMSTYRFVAGWGSQVTDKHAGCFLHTTYQHVKHAGYLSEWVAAAVTRLSTAAQELLQVAIGHEFHDDLCLHSLRHDAYQPNNKRWLELPVDRHTGLILNSFFDLSSYRVYVDSEVADCLWNFRPLSYLTLCEAIDRFRSIATWVHSNLIFW